METAIFVGVLIGWLIGQVLLAFFQDEIFAFIDRLVEKVRRACGLS